MRTRGITLVEVLLAATIAALVMVAAGTAYVSGLTAARNMGRGREAIARHAAFENALTDLFAHIYVDADSTNDATYFLSGDSLAGKSSAPASGSNGSTTDENGSLAFTVLGRRLPSTLLSSTDDFETNNEKYGPAAGVTEIQLGTSAIGTPTAAQEGLFLREQAPSDADPTQGGTESLLSEDIDTISFEFYDGTAWVTTWDTTTQSTRRVPSAIRVTYRLREETEDRIVVFAVPSSDVTPDAPLEQETPTS